MRAKEYLRQIKDLDAFINNKVHDLDRLRELSVSIKAQSYDNERVQTSAKNSTEDLILKIIDLENEINDAIDGYVDLRQQIIRQIESIGKDYPIYYRILYSRYVGCMTLKEIAVTEEYSYDRMKHLHGYALQEFEQKFL